MTFLCARTEGMWEVTLGADAGEDLPLTFLCARTEGMWEVTLGADAGEDLPPPPSSSRDLGHGSSFAHSRRWLANFHCVGPMPPPHNLLRRSLLPSGYIRLKRKATPK
jgi:hypothetical protein